MALRHHSNPNRPCIFRGPIWYVRKMLYFPKSSTSRSLVSLTITLRKHHSIHRDYLSHVRDFSFEMYHGKWVCPKMRYPKLPMVYHHVCNYINNYLLGVHNFQTNHVVTNHKLHVEVIRRFPKIGLPQVLIHL